MPTEPAAKPLRILGLDPGSRNTGYGIVDSSGGQLTVVRYGRFSAPAREDLASRLARLSLELESLLDELRPARAALETPFQGLNPRSLIVLAQARGALLASLARRQVEIREYSPTEVKSAVSGYGRAGKDQVGRMVCRMLAIEGATPSNDATDALAVAICCANRARHDAITAARAGT